MATITYRTARIVRVDRMMSSRNGNPRYRLTYQPTDNPSACLVARTEVDSMVAYGIGDHLVGKTCKLRLKDARGMQYVTLVEEPPKQEPKQERLQTTTTLPAWKQMDPEEDPAPGGLPLWSGDMPPPAIGDLIYLRINGIGNARVIAYCVDTGYLAVMCVPLNPPAWLIRNHVDAGSVLERDGALAFGAEIAPPRSN